MSTHSKTVTVRLDPATKSRLEELAQQTRRTKSFLAAEAIADYVQRELEIIEGIKRGLEDIKAGRTDSHEEAKRRIRATLARTRKQ